MVRLNDGERELAKPRWGLLPRDARHPFERGFINARSETVHRKQSLRVAFQKRRCIVPISGWFEWRSEEEVRRPYWIRPLDTDLFAIAGVWQPREGDWPARDSFAVLTTNPAPAIAHIHDRQPLILDEGHIDAWLDDEADEERLLAIAHTQAQGAFEVRRVSHALNNPGHDVPEVLTPIAA